MGIDAVDGFDLPGLLRRIRRRADLSQRELAGRLGIPKSTVAAAESGARGLDVHVLAASAALAALRVVLVDADGREVRGMDPGGVRDRIGRRFPAHLDTVLSEERASRWEHQPHVPQPTYTFDRRIPWHDSRDRADRPDDHLRPRPGDSPGERAQARRAESRRRRDAELRRRLEAGELAGLPDPWTCTCPPACDELDDRSGPPVHAEACPCRCDVG